MVLQEEHVQHEERTTSTTTRTAWRPAIDSIDSIDRAIGRSSPSCDRSTKFPPSFREIFARFRAVFPQNFPKNFWKLLEFIAAIDSIQKSSKSELSSRFFGRLKFSSKKFCGRRSIRSIVRSVNRVDRFDRFDNFVDFLFCFFLPRRGARDLSCLKGSALYDA